MGFRHVVLFLAFFGLTCCYIVRSSFSVALVSMVKSPRNSTPIRTSPNSCSEHLIELDNQTSLQSLNASKLYATQLGEQYDWDTRTQSFLLGALFYGCLVSQLPSGILVQHFSMRWIFGLTTLLCSVLSLLTPIASSWGSGAVIAIRVVQGLLQSIQAPVLGKVVAMWFPSSERSRAFSFIGSGIYVGNIVGMSLSGVIAASEFMGGWPSIFYVCGVFGCLWSVLWMTLVSDLPQQHKCVSDAEIIIITKDQENRSSEKAAVPWKAICTSVPLWSCNFAVVGQMTALFVMTTELPLYLSNVFHFDIRSSGALSSGPFITRFVVALVGSYIADALRKSGKLSVTFIRKLLNSIGILGFSLCLAAIAFVGCRKYLIVVLLCISSGFTGFSLSGGLVAAVDISPTFSATTSGISYTLAYVSGAVMPYIFGLFTSSGHTARNWSSAFLLCAALILATGLQFLIFGSAERQSWDSVKQKEAVEIKSTNLEQSEQKDLNGITNPALEEETTTYIESTKL